MRPTYYNVNTTPNKSIPIIRHPQVIPVDFQLSEVIEPIIIAATKNMTAIIKSIIFIIIHNI
jgi:hypothetical protein